MNAAPAAGELTRDAYRLRMADLVFRALNEPHPGGQYSPFPGDGIYFFLNFAALAVAKCSDEELADLGDVVFKAIQARGRRAPAKPKQPAAVFPFRVITGGTHADAS